MVMALECFDVYSEKTEWQSKQSGENNAAFALHLKYLLANYLSSFHIFLTISDYMLLEDHHVNTEIGKLAVN